MKFGSLLPRLALALALVAGMAWGQAKPEKQAPKPAPGAKAQPAPPAQEPVGSPYSGMYTFTRDGEFVQLDFQEGGKLDGFISRFGIGESDQDTLMDQFIKSGTHSGHDVSFTTAPVHSVWYEFKGRVDRGPGKTLRDEGYYVIKGTLKEFTESADKKTTARTRELTLKSFPQDEQ